MITIDVFDLRMGLLFNFQLGDVDEFRLILRMPPDVYAWLWEDVRPKRTKENTNYQKAV